MSGSAPIDRYPLFNHDNAAQGIDRIVEGLVSVANYEWYEQCILKEAWHMKDPTRFNHEFIRFVIWYLLHSPDRQRPCYHIVTIDVHRSGGVGVGYSNSGAISANSSSASLPSDSGSSNSQPVPARDEIHIHPQNERLIKNQYPGAVSHCHLKFNQSEPTSVIQLFALLSAITRWKQNYDFTSTNCYWLSRTLWEAMLEYFPYDKETPCKPGSRGQLGLFTNVTAKDIEKMKQCVKGEVRTLYETRLREIRDLAIANKEAANAGVEEEKLKRVAAEERADAANDRANAANGRANAANDRANAANAEKEEEKLKRVKLEEEKLKRVAAEERADAANDRANAANAEKEEEKLKRVKLEEKLAILEATNTQVGQAGPH